MDYQLDYVRTPIDRPSVTQLAMLRLVPPAPFKEIANERGWVGETNTHTDTWTYVSLSHVLNVLVVGE